MRRPRRSRDIRGACKEMPLKGVLRRDLVESSCIEISHRGLVKRPCRATVKRPRRFRDIRGACIEMSHLGVL